MARKPTNRVAVALASPIVLTIVASVVALIIVHPFYRDDLLAVALPLLAGQLVISGWLWLFLRITAPHDRWIVIGPALALHFVLVVAVYALHLKLIGLFVGL